MSELPRTPFYYKVTSAYRLTGMGEVSHSLYLKANWIVGGGRTPGEDDAFLVLVGESSANSLRVEASPLLPLDIVTYGVEVVEPAIRDAMAAISCLLGICIGSNAPTVPKDQYWLVGEIDLGGGAGWLDGGEMLVKMADQTAESILKINLTSDWPNEDPLLAYGRLWPEVAFPIRDFGGEARRAMNALASAVTGLLPPEF